MAFIEVGALANAAPQKQPRITIWLCSALVLVFFIWSANAPLSITVRGDGRVVPSMNSQLIQNLEGGIVKQVFVTAGDEVEKGQQLVQMDSTQFESAFLELQDQKLALLIKLERLRAEKNHDADYIPNPEYVVQAPDYTTSELALYQARKLEYQANLDTFSNMAELREKEVRLLEPMAKRQAVPELEVIRARQLAVEAAGKVDALHTEFEAKRSQEYSDALISLGQIEEQIRSKQDQLTRTNITSPVRGIVNRVFTTTVGGVVASGDSLVEILPLDQPLRIEAKVDPKDIGFVFAGMGASVQLTAFDFAVYGTLEGHVAHVGADTVVDETRREPYHYYEVLVELERTSLHGPGGEVDIRPGMQAVVELDAGERTVLQYLLKPLFRSSAALTER